MEELVASAAAAAAEEEEARGCRIENDEVPCALPRRGMWHEEMQAVLYPNCSSNLFFLMIQSNPTQASNLICSDLSDEPNHRN